MNYTPATLKSLSDTLGVSISTISRVLSGKARQYRISVKTENRIKQEADRQGFSPNQIASSLRLKKTNTLGLIIPNISNSFFSDVARHVEIEARKNGYFIFLCDSQENPQHELESMQLLRQRSIDGLIITPVAPMPDQLLELHATGTPLVLVDRCFPGTKLPCVTSRNEEGAFTAVVHLIRMGHRRIACIKGPDGISTSDDRLLGYRKALQKNGISADETLILGNGFDKACGYTSTKELLRHPHRPTAIFSMGNLISFGAMLAILEAGLSIPDDISLVSFDDHYYTDYLATPLTTVAQQPKELGKAAVKLLLQQLNSTDGTQETTVLIDTHLRTRKSVKEIRSN